MPHLVFHVCEHLFYDFHKFHLVTVLDDNAQNSCCVNSGTFFRGLHKSLDSRQKNIIFIFLDRILLQINKNFAKHRFGNKEFDDVARLP